MRLLVNCPSGASRLLQVDGSSKVGDVKVLLEDQEGVRSHQQVLCFAGQILDDKSALSDYFMEQYTLSEVVLYLSKRLAKPKRILLASHAKLGHASAVLVEADMPVIEIQGLLESRGLAVGSYTTDTVLVKRQDGSTVPIRVDPTEGVVRLEARIARQEGVQPQSMTFCRAQDGVLHCTIWPSTPEAQNTYPVYKRSVIPQPIAPERKPGKGQQLLPQLVKELCVLP